MCDEQNISQPTVAEKNHYQITIHGYLDDSWSNQFGGLAFHHEIAKDETPTTTLQGYVIDQAALFGILNGLYGLGFTILSVSKYDK